MPKDSAGERLIGWFGGVAAENLDEHPTAVRHWLMTGYRLMTQKSLLAGDRRSLPSGRRGYALFMRSVVDAMADPAHSIVTSIFTPSEVFLAMGVKPMTAEAVASFASGAKAEGAFIGTAEATGIPETYCSYHKALMGLATSGVLEPRPMVASTSVACDANVLTFRALQHSWGCERSYVDVPSEVDETSIRYVADQLREMAMAAEDAYSAHLNQELLSRLVARSLETDALLDRTLEARRGRYLHNTMTLDMMEMLDFHLSLGTHEARRLAKGMLRDFAEADRFDGVSLVWAHVSPYFLGSIGDQINCSPDAQIVASDMMFDHLAPEGGLLFDATDPFEAMAERLARNCFNGPADRRIETLRTLVRRTDADAVVLFCHWGCKQTAGAAQLIRHALEAEGTPVLVLDGDAVDRRNCMEGQMATRFSAFMEMVRNGKGRA